MKSRAGWNGVSYPMLTIKDDDDDDNLEFVDSTGADSRLVCTLVSLFIKALSPTS